ncbi:MAG: hypothetical protein KJ676_02605 [Alphaproteobacteria bacterium]|nr:hypothetical protein [Alphaproteobacteria bacterium]MBU1525154.1 hypothetical protein [Alphaproteobacteria bacterium]MBU2116407.1 hypothetical protein [Alphaproteobacteria bacterium]MBU2351216.1 hypothetical protein [Alphaproteobacteria bacterium]MBU2381549.1 hypothetical protein [Alphaproteobacteria bacterium]
MKAAAVIPAMMAASLCATAAAAQEARIDPVETPRVFREAVLGFCAERIHGEALIPHSVDPTAEGWLDLRRDAVVTGGQRIFSGRVHAETGVIVDVAPNGRTCFVQINLATPVLGVVDELRAEILQRPGATLLDERNMPEGHHTLYGLLDDQSDAVRLFAVNDSGSDGPVATVIVAMGSKEN